MTYDPLKKFLERTQNEAYKDEQRERLRSQLDINREEWEKQENEKRMKELREVKKLRNEANFLASESDNANGEVVNVAGGKRISINELAERIAELMGKEINPEHHEERAGDVKHSLADISKGEKLMNYRPEYSIIDGLKDTITHFGGVI